MSPTPPYLNNLGAYMPQDRRFALLHGATLPDRAVGTVMFADVTGFTPLAEALVQALGPRRGAEELTALLNQVYSALIDQVERFGGSVISFSGDAMTCWFAESVVSGWSSVASPPMPITTDNRQRAVLRAVACALVMRNAMGAFAAVPTPSGSAALSVKVALASGPVRRFLLGDAQIQTLDVLAGPTLDRLATSAQLAEHDDVVLDAQTLAELAGAAAVATWRADAQTGACAAVIADLLQPVAPAPQSALPANSVAEDHVRSWLLPAIYQRLHSSTDPLLAELRPAVALMLQFGGLDYDQEDAGSQLDAYIRQVQQIVTRYEGILVDVTMADKSGYLYAAFGVPIAHEDDPTRALRAALELRDQPVTPLKSTIRIGLSQGTMRTGPYGGRSRCTYGVLGDEVNLACRLMSAAPPSQILVSGRLQKVLSSNFFWAALPTMQLKGKQSPIEVYRLLGTSSPASAALHPAFASTEMIGRTTERAALNEALESLMSGTGGVVVIEGEPGIGKSRLVAELTDALSKRGGAGLLGAGQSIEQQTAYRAWRDIFTAYFDLDDLRDLAECQARVQRLASTALPTLIERIPLLNDILNLGLPETNLTLSLSGRLRNESLSELLVELLRVRAATQPIVLVLEDAHWLDSLSWALAARVARTLVAEQLALLLVVAMRPIEASQLGMPHLRTLLGTSGVRWMRLPQLREQDTLALAAARLGLAVDELPAPVAVLLRERAGGNPFFAEELLATLRERGLIRIEADGDRLARARCVVVGDLNQAGQLLPETLQGLLLARIDRLAPDQQLTVKVAAVVGPTFAFAPLHFARSRQSPIAGPVIKEQLRALAAQDYTWLEEPEPNLAYRFKHILTQEAAYETLLYAQRRTLHSSVAAWYEQSFVDTETRRHGEEVDSSTISQSPSLPGSVPPSLPVSRSPYLPLLAHHYHHAELPERERHYAWLAGLQAAEQYANAEAVAFFTRALELTPQQDPLRWQLLAAREQVYDVQAVRDAQARDLQELEALAQDDAQRRAEVALRWASYHNLTSNYAAAIEACRATIAWAQQSGDRVSEATAYLSWGRTYVWRSEGQAADLQLEQALRLARAHGLRSVEGEALRLLGVNRFYRYQYDAVRTLFEQSLQCFRDSSDRRGETRTLNNLASLDETIGAYAASYTRYEQALTLCRAIGDRWFESALLTNMGNLVSSEGNYQQALPWYDQAEQICHATDDLNSLALVYHNRGDTLLKLGCYADARAQLESALSLFRQMDYQRDMSCILTMLSFLEHCLGAEAAAEAYAQQSLVVAQATEYIDIQAEALHALGLALEGLGRREEAAAAYAETLRITHTQGHAGETLGTRACHALLTLRMGEPARAQAHMADILHALTTNIRIDINLRLRIGLACYQIAAATNDPRARALLEDAHSLLQLHAAKITDPSLHRSFLEQVPAHRTIVAEYRRVTSDE